MDTSTASESSVSNIHHSDSELAQPAPTEQWPVGTGSAPTSGIGVGDDTEPSLSISSAYRTAIATSFELANLPSLSARHSGEPKCVAAIDRMRAIYTDPAFARTHAAGECGCDSLDVMFMHQELEGLPDVLLACEGTREDMEMQMEMEGMEMDEEERARAEIRRSIANYLRRAARLERKTEQVKRRKIPNLQPDPALVAWMQSVDEEMARRIGVGFPGVSSIVMSVAGNDTAKEGVSS